MRSSNALYEYDIEVMCFFGRVRGDSKEVAGVAVDISLIVLYS